MLVFFLSFIYFAHSLSVYLFVFLQPSLSPAFSSPHFLVPWLWFSLCPASLSMSLSSLSSPSLSVPQSLSIISLHSSLHRLLSPLLPPHLKLTLKSGIHFVRNSFPGVIRQALSLSQSPSLSVLVTPSPELLAAQSQTTQSHLTQNSQTAQSLMAQFVQQQSRFVNHVQALLNERYPPTPSSATVTTTTATSSGAGKVFALPFTAWTKITTERETERSAKR